MQDMGGLRPAMPISVITMGIGFAALVGLPPTSGFFSKDAIVAETLHATTQRQESPVGLGTAVVILICALLTVAVTAAYATRAWLLTFFGPARSTVAVHEAPPVMYLPLVALAVPALLLGLAAVGVRELRPQATSALVSLALIVAGAGAAYAAWQRAPNRDPAAALGPTRTAFASAFHTDDLYERTVARMVRRIAVGIVGVDDKVIGRTVTRTGGGTRLLGGALRLTENGNVQAYLTGVLAGVLVLAVGVAMFA
jgi:NADH-quinone oxidoreductase subunit L